MNSFTKKSQFMKSAEYILEHSTLPLKEDCIIVDGVLYERMCQTVHPYGFEHKYRFFFDVDDYDYLVDNAELEKKLDEKFSALEQYRKIKGNYNVVVDEYQDDEETESLNIVFTTLDRKTAAALEKVCDDANTTEEADGGYHFQGWIKVKKQ